MKNSKLIIDSLDVILSKRGLGKGGAVQKTIDREVLRRSEPYMPRDTGRSISSGRTNTKLGSGEVIYDTPYIREIYYSNKDYNGSPQRGARWFERMKTADSRSILKSASKESGGRF